MTSDSKTKPEDQDTVDTETPEDPKNRKLTMEELASVTGGDGDNDDFVLNTSPSTPDWGNNG